MIRRLRDQAGQALPLALAIMTIFGILTAAITINGAANDRSSLKSADARQAFELAQTALAYGEGAVYAATSAPSSTVQSIPSQSGGGTGTYQITAVSGSCSCTWSITATGTVDRVSRTITAIATGASTKSVTNSGVWNYVYADAGGTTCATSWNGSVTISVPILVRGDLCLSGSVNYTGSQLQVGGNLSVTGSAKVGSSSSKISQLEVGLDSSSTSTCNSVTPGTGVCDGSHSPIYANSVVKGVGVTPQMPCIGQPATYPVNSTTPLDPQCANPDPVTGVQQNGTWWKLHSVYNTQAGTTQTGCPANLFDNNSTLDNSDTSISSVMFGNTDYDCKVGSNEIKWTHSSKTLYVNGTLYFDGSLSISGTIVYTGQASLYFTGGVSMGNNSSFCGIANCTNSWNPDTNGVIFIAGCWAGTTGATLTTSGCVSLGGGATAQFGAYCTTNYSTSGGSSNMGPVLANTLSIGGNTASLIPFHYMPPGTPLNTQTQSIPAQAPSSWSG